MLKLQQKCNEIKMKWFCLMQLVLILLPEIIHFSTLSVYGDGHLDSKHVLTVAFGMSFNESLVDPFRMRCKR